MSTSAIGLAIKAKGLTHLEVANRLGVSRQAVQKWATGVQAPTYDNLQRLAEVLACSVSDLVANKGLDPVPGGTLITNAKMSEDQSDAVYVPLLDVYASAGHGTDSTAQDLIKGISLSGSFLRSLPGVISLRNLHIIRVIGDSMEPTIEKNGYVLIDGSQRSITADSIYCIQAENQIFVKRVQRSLDGSITLISDNSQYQPMRIQKEFLENAQIIGRVVFSFRFQTL